MRKELLKDVFANLECLGSCILTRAPFSIYTQGVPSHCPHMEGEAERTL